MRTLKISLTVFMTMTLIVSIFFNILILGSANGTLVFKHDDQKLLSMISAQRLILDDSQISNSKSNGYQLTKTVEENGVKTKEVYNIHFNEKYEATLSILKETKTKDTVKTKKYYREGFVYDEKGNQYPSEANPKTLFAEAMASVNAYQDALATDIETTKTKVENNFTFDSFPFIELQYTIKREESTVTFTYDLDGCLKTINISYKNGKKENYSISNLTKKVYIPSSKVQQAG